MARPALTATPASCRLGAPLGSFHAGLLHCLLPQLSSPRLAVSKRAVIALGHLAATCNADLFTELADHLLERLPGPSTPTSPAALRTLVQCVGSVGRQAGHRLGEGRTGWDRQGGRGQGPGGVGPGFQEGQRGKGLQALGGEAIDLGWGRLSYGKGGDHCSEGWKRRVWISVWANLRREQRD